MRKKQIKFLFPLGALLLALVVLAGCRPSETLTQLMNAMNALNPSTEDMKTEDEENESEPDDKMDPIDETRDDAQIEATEELIGQMLENMDWETAQESLMAVYSASAGSSEWGSQQYNPDRLTYGSGNGNSPLVLNVKGDEVNSASKIAGSGEGSGSGEASIIETTDIQESGGEETPLPLTDADGNYNDLDELGSQNDENSDGHASNNNEDESSDGGASVDGGGDPGDGGDDSGEGTTYSPPDWGNKGERIAATGELANVVCMLGGSDRLCATSESFRDNTLAKEAFNSDDHMEYETPWTGDGSYWLDNGDAYGDDFRYLMEYLQPDVIFDLNYTSFSPDQAARIVSEYGKVYENVSMTSQSNINSCMSTVAGYLGSAAESKVTEYLDWVSQVTSKDLSGNNNKTETIYIEAWDDNVKTMCTSPDTNQTMEVAYGGAAVIKIGSSFRPLNEYLKFAQVYDWAASPHTRGISLSSQYGTIKASEGDSYHLYGQFYWLDMTGQSGISTSEAYVTTPGSMCYVTPVYDPVFSTGSDSYYSTPSVWFDGAQYETIDNSTSTSDLNGRLSFGNVFPGYGRSNGTPNWCTVIVKDKTIKEKLEANDAWAYSNPYGTWVSSSNPLVGGSNRVTYNGLLRSQNGSTYYTTVADQYDVVVNPKGLGDWVEGSQESILESVWASWKIADDQQESYVRVKIQEFYSKFYGLNWDSNGSEITDILNGKYVN